MRQVRRLCIFGGELLSLHSQLNAGVETEREREREGEREGERGGERVVVG